MKTKRRVLAVLLCLSLVVTLFTACGGDKATGTNEASPAVKEQKVFHLVHSDTGIPESAYEIYAKYFKQHLEELSDGAWTVEVASDAQFGTEPEEILSLSMGQLEGSFITNISYSNVCKDMYIFLLPYMLRNYGEVDAVLSNEKIREKLNASLLRDANAVAIDYGHMGLRYLMFKEDTFSDYPTVEEIANKKIRVTETPITVGVFKALGAVPTALNVPEMITGLQQGTIDGVTYSILPANAVGFDEMCKVILKTCHYYVHGIAVYSVNFWDSLTEEEQGWFTEASRQACTEQRAEVESMEGGMIEDFAAKGCVTREVDMQTFIDVTRDCYDEFKQQIDPELVKLVEDALAEYRANN